MKIIEAAMDRGDKIGLGQASARLNVYIANRPPLALYQSLKYCHAMSPGEIAHICTETGNHWRKIFNVYAKLVFGLSGSRFGPQVDRYSRWQAYRDDALLMSGSETALWFSPPEKDESEAIHIVAGKQYAAGVCQQGLTSLDCDFSINRGRRLIACPYFDYRQLSNKKLAVLTELIHSLA